jgi:hypothetical protein
VRASCFQRRSERNLTLDTFVKVNASADVTEHGFAIYYISNGHYPASVL